MKSARAAKTALVIVHVQNGFKHPTHWGSSRNNPSCEANISKIITAVLQYNQAIIPIGSGAEPIELCHIHHHSKQEDSLLFPGAKITIRHPVAEPRAGEPVFIKNVNSAFIGANLEAHLRERNVRQLIIFGLTTNHCASTTTRMAGNLEVTAGPRGEEGDVVLVSDACATFAKGAFDTDIVHRVSLDIINGEFAQVLDAAEVLEILLK